MSVISDFFEWLMRFTIDSYRFGFDGVWNYLLVGICMGFVIVTINMFGASWKELTIWDRHQTIFVVSRFLGGVFLWPLFLFLTPVVVPALMFCLLGILVIGLCWRCCTREKSLPSN